MAEQAVSYVPRLAAGVGTKRQIRGRLQQVGGPFGVDGAREYGRFMALGGFANNRWSMAFMALEASAAIPDGNEVTFADAPDSDRLHSMTTPFVSLVEILRQGEIERGNWEFAGRIDSHMQTAGFVLSSTRGYFPERDL